MNELLSASDLVTLLKKTSHTLATAESCTGGMMGNLITDIPGASQIYLGGVISYAYSVKQDVLGVSGELLQTKGAVCGEVAVQMAQGVQKLTGADYALSATGNAGPGHDDHNPNVGEIYIGLAAPDFAKYVRLQLNGDRAENRRETCAQAFQLLIDILNDER